MDYIDKIAEYALKQGSDSLILIILLYSFFFRPLLSRMSGVSSYIRRFLALQKQHARNEKALVDVLQELSTNIRERRTRHYLEERDCK